jgi:ABC-type uncharacterized transport system ATPase component
MSNQLLGNEAIAAAMKAGNVNISSGNIEVEVMDLNQDSIEAQRKHAELLKKYESQKRARTVIVPTSAEDVKLRLRELGHPITLFGEDNSDRRTRLREVIAAMELGNEELAKLQVKK